MGRHERPEPVELPIDDDAEATLDGHDALAAPTDTELAEGIQLGHIIDVDDDDDAGPLPRELLAGDQSDAMVRAQGLKRALLAAGVPEVSIELQIGRPGPADRWNAVRPVCDFSHHVVSQWREGVFTPVLRLCKTGRSDVPGPLCNGYAGWDLCYRILCMGWANHPGAGGPYTINGHTIPKDSARPVTWGTEYEGGIRAADWDRVHTNPRNGRSMTFREFMGRANAGIQDFFGRGVWPREAHMEHKTWAPGRKPDRLEYTRVTGIAEIKRYARPLEDEVTPEDREAIATAVVTKLKTDTGFRKDLVDEFWYRDSGLVFKSGPDVGKPIPMWLALRDNMLYVGQNTDVGKGGGRTLGQILQRAEAASDQILGPEPPPNQ